MPKFDFLSPDIQLREVDLSELPPEPSNDGALIIGIAPKGPAMKVTKVNSISSLRQIYGAAQNGLAGDDEIWRNGNKSVPTYGLYAAEAWLASETSPVTFVRLAGESTATTTKAGWNLGGAANDASDPADNRGAYGLWICESGSSGELNGTIAAVIYTNGAVPTLSGTIAGTTTTTSSIGTFMVSDTNGSRNSFVIEIHTAVGTSEKYSINMDPNSSGFIRKVMNTNPHYLISGQKNKQEKYFIGETFETNLENVLRDESSINAGKQFGIIMPLAKNASIGTNWVNRNIGAAPSKTGYVIANDPNPQNSTGSYSAANMQKLFRLVSHQDGEEFQKKYSVRITLDGEGSAQSPYPTFSLELIDMETKSVVEKGSGLNLNENDPSNFIAAYFGNQYVQYNETTEKFETYGEYPKKSDYFYVEMHPDFKQAGKGAIPFGFFGPYKPSAFKIEGAASDGSGSLSDNVANAYAFNATGSAIYAGHETGGFAHFQIGATASLSWPSLGLTESGSLGGNHYTANGVFGLRHTYKHSTDTSFIGYHYTSDVSQDFRDLVRSLPSDIDVHTGGTGTEASFVFSLDEIVQDASNTSKYYYQSGAHASGDSYTGDNGLTALFTAGINKFMMPFMGGVEGNDITRVDPFSSTKVLSGQTSQGHYAYKAVEKAIDMVKDSEFVQYDVISVPGLTNQNLNTRLLGNTEARADALAIVDLDSGWRPSHENNSETRGTVSAVIASANTADYNTSYGAVYYPEVKIGNAPSIAVPSSVAGIGAIASSERQTDAPWFAPAGFNRGGLGNLGGPSGPKVTGVYNILSKADRDKLYIKNINPIANFPNEGAVVFGQKTLQQTPSALDRINVRRLMIYLKKEIGAVARTILFDNNLNATWNRFKSQADPILADAKSGFGIADYKLVLDETTTTPDLIDRNIMYAKVFIKPAYAIEFIAIDFNITRSGIEF
jgi:hypothetical protein